MTITLGLDIGTNSVGSAWIDTDEQTVDLGVSVFPAGVDESDDKRGAPKNQERRGKRSLRRSVARRAQRRRQLRALLTAHGLLPTDADELRQLFQSDPWQLRRRALRERLDPHEFGRVLLHLAQRRGAIGLHMPEKEDDAESDASDAKDSEDAKVKAAVEHTKSEMRRLGAMSYGELLSILSEQRRKPVLADGGKPKRDGNGEVITFGDRPIRNRLDSFEFHADRQLIRDEFNAIWKKQRELKGKLAALLTDELKAALDEPTGDATWRHGGAIFGQRRTYWSTGTLGRCDLEPTDRCAPVADRHASYFRVIESVNNIRLREPGASDFRSLTPDERDAVIHRLRTQKTGSVATVRGALGIDKRSLKKRGLAETDIPLNIELDKDREINTDWFHREIVLSAIGEDVWEKWTERTREGLNRTILRFDPQEDEDRARLVAVAQRMGIDEPGVERLVKAWRSRPKLERRLKLSRRAIMNLLPYMHQSLPGGQWPTQIEARALFAADADALDAPSNQPATDDQRARYEIGATILAKDERHFLRKHPDLLPPAPTLSNPVVRKAIYEVRRHLIAHIRSHGGRKPDRVVIEFARETTKPAKVSDRLLFRNRLRAKIRQSIIDDVIGDSAHTMSHNQLRAAVDRVILARQQKGRCAYCGDPITDRMAAAGNGLEIDHIIPYSRCGDNSLHNRVLCFRKSNRDRGRQTPREWWGEQFGDRVAPVRFMDGYEPTRDDNDYFTKRDYAAKWRNFSRETVPSEWRGSQLTDTAYAAREVQDYLQRALWPMERSHLQGGPRRIFVTKGAYTSLLRRDWQLYQRLLARGSSRSDVVQASAKNRGDHREHAIDAVAIALTDGQRIQSLAAYQRLMEDERVNAAAQGREPRRLERRPVNPPWGDTKTFRALVLSQLYSSFDGKDGQHNGHRPIVVSHRPVGRRITGRLHEDTLFGSVPDDPTLFTGHKKVADLKPNHLRLPRPETRSEAVERLSRRYFTSGRFENVAEARKRARAVVANPSFTPKIVDPPPEKSGLVRDRSFRRILREQITLRLEALGVGRDADSFTSGDMKQILKEGPIRMPSGVPIHRVTLLRVMTDPVIIHRKRWDQRAGKWVRDTGRQAHATASQRTRADRAYVGGNNHHIEIRENDKGRWSGCIVTMYEAARRVRVEKRDAVDRADDAERGGRFVMSLAEGETVYLTPKGGGKPDYFVVFKLDKPQTIQFKPHWDARRAKGERDTDGNIVADSTRHEMPVTAAQLRDLAPAGVASPIKVSVDPLGRVRPLEPQGVVKD